MTRQRLGVCLLMGLAFGACRTRPDLANGFDAEVLRQELSVTSQDFYQLRVREVLELQAPAGALVRHVHVEWLLDKVPVGTTDMGLDAPVEQDGHVAVSFQAALQTAATLADVERLAKRGTLTLVARGVVTLTRGDAVKDVELARARDIRAARPLVARIREVDAARYNNGEISTTFYLGLENPNAFAVRLKEVPYKLSLGGEPVGEGAVGQAELVAPSSTAEFELDVFLDRSNPDLLDRLGKLSSIPYVLQGTVRAEPYEKPFELSGSLHLQRG